MAEHAGPLPGLGRTLDARLGPSITFSLNVQQNFVMLPPQGGQGNGQVNYSIKPADYTCGSSQPTNATVAQQAYPNMHPPQEDARQGLYQRSTTHYETHWQTDPTTNATYAATVGSYPMAAAQQSAAALVGYAQDQANRASAAHQEMSARYAAQT